MPRMSFSAAPLRDDLEAIERSLRSGNVEGAEVVLDVLIEDLTMASQTPRPAYIGHRPATPPEAGEYNAILIFLVGCRANVRKGNIAAAQTNATNALKRFEASPWYPNSLDQKPVVQKGE